MSSVAPLIPESAATSTFLGQESPADVPASLLGQMLGNSRQPRANLAGFLAAGSPAEAISQWFLGAPPRDPQRIASVLAAGICRIDRALNEQINALLHHPEFQRLESSWRGLEYLASRAAEHACDEIQLRVLSVGWREIERDFREAREFDQSELFRKIYGKEFDQPGGTPYGVLLADFEIHPAPGPGHPHNDMRILRSLSEVAAAAFCPIILGVSPAMLGLDAFADLEQAHNFSRLLDDPENPTYLAWRSVRQMDEARFLGLVLPRVLMRAPYRDDGTRVDEFVFTEETGAPDAAQHLWGSAGYAFGDVLMRAFAQSGWLANIRGVERDVQAGGLVDSLPVVSFATETEFVATKCAADVMVDGDLERELTDLGFISLCHCQHTPYLAFYSTPSIQKALNYSSADATQNARLSAMLQHVFCVSRFAHYLKVMARDEVGSATTPEALEVKLHNWLMAYVNSSDDLTPEAKARCPLKAAAVKVSARPGEPGKYGCVFHLQPHFELENFSVRLQLETEFTAASVKP